MLLKFIVCTLIVHVCFYVLYVGYRKDGNDSMMTTCTLSYSMFWTSLLLGDAITFFLLLLIFNLFVLVMDKIIF